MRVLIIMALLFAAGEAAMALDVPLPRPRPANLNDRFGIPPRTVAPAVGPTALAPAPELHGLTSPPTRPTLSACEFRLSAVASYAAIPALSGPGECGADDAVRLDAIKMPDQSAVPLNPPAILRCEMAETVAHWVRDDIGPAAATLGSRLASIVNFDSYSCRGRNRIIGAKLSEHGKANALDIRALRLAGGIAVEPTDPKVAKDFRERLRRSACARFATVLGPGSDGYHENHIHVDLAHRTHGYRLCHWDVHDKPDIANVPLPLPRPTAAK